MLISSFKKRDDSAAGEIRMAVSIFKPEYFYVFKFTKCLQVI